MYNITTRKQTNNDYRKQQRDY